MTDVYCLWCGKASTPVAGVFAFGCSPLCVQTAREAPAELERLKNEVETFHRVAQERNDALEHLEAQRIQINELKAELIVLEGAAAAATPRRRVRHSKAGAGLGLDALADQLAQGQSVILGRPNAEQLAELRKLELEGKWAITVIGQVEGDVRLICENDRGAAVAQAIAYLQQKNERP